MIFGIFMNSFSISGYPKTRFLVNASFTALKAVSQSSVHTSLEFPLPHRGSNFLPFFE